MDMVYMLWLLWENILPWLTRPSPKLEATDGGVVSNLNIKSKKTKNLISNVETVTGSKNRPSENNVGQGRPADYTARGGGVIRIDKIHVDEIDGDLDLSVRVTKS